MASVSHSDFFNPKEAGFRSAYAHYENGLLCMLALGEGADVNSIQQLAAGKFWKKKELGTIAEKLYQKTLLNVLRQLRRSQSVSGSKNLSIEELQNKVNACAQRFVWSLDTLHGLLIENTPKAAFVNHAKVATSLPSASPVQGDMMARFFAVSHHLRLHSVWRPESWALEEHVVTEIIGTKDDLLRENVRIKAYSEIAKKLGLSALSLAPPAEEITQLQASSPTFAPSQLALPQPQKAQPIVGPDSRELGLAGHREVGPVRVIGERESPTVSFAEPATLMPALATADNILQTDPLALHQIQEPQRPVEPPQSKSVIFRILSFLSLGILPLAFSLWHALLGERLTSSD